MDIPDPRLETELVFIEKENEREDCIKLDTLLELELGDEFEYDSHMDRSTKKPAIEGGMIEPANGTYTVTKKDVPHIALTLM